MTGFLTDSLIISNPAINEIEKFKAIAGKAIYIIEHTDKGAMGVSLNQNYSKSMAEIGEQLPAFLKIDQTALLTDKIIMGGPVGANLPWILSRNTNEYEKQVKNPALSLNFSDTAFEQYSVEHFGVCGIGTFGWGAGQLEQELAAYLWHYFPVTTETLNSVPFDDYYRGAVQVLDALRFA